MFDDEMSLNDNVFDTISARRQFENNNHDFKRNMPRLYPDKFSRRNLVASKV